MLQDQPVLSWRTRERGERREEKEKDSVVACRSMGILPMIPTGPACSGMPRGAWLFLP